METRNGVAGHVFVAPSHRQLVAWLGIIAGAVSCWASIQVWPFSPVGSALLVAGSLVLLGQYLLRLRNLPRPTLRIASCEIEYMPVFGWSPRRIRSLDVVAIASSSKNKVVLKTATGRERIVLGWLSREQRDAARAAIERWVENRDGDEGSTRPHEAS